MNLAGLADTLAHQSGVISRRQILDSGGGSADLERMLRRRELTRTLPGVFVDHTGEPTWQQRAWTGVLFHWPAALAGHAALGAQLGMKWRHHHEDRLIELAVPQRRHVAAQPGYSISRPNNFEDRVLWNGAPPRIRVEPATIDLAARATTDLEAIGLVNDVCQVRYSTPQRLRDHLASRGRVSRRALLNAVLDDIEQGTTSVLEHGYLNLVERPHGLPTGRRQEPGPAGSLRDVDYGNGLVIELDGRQFHDTRVQRDKDLDRDLLTAAAGGITARLGWGQVFDRSCWTAALVADLLAQRGWPDWPLVCRPGCAVATLLASGGLDRLRSVG